MIKYSEATKREALETYQREGIRAACERFHVPSSSIYRWRNIEKRETLLAQVAQEKFETTDRQEKPKEGIANRPSRMAECKGQLRREQAEDYRP